MDDGLVNIEGIINELQQRSKQVNSMRKFDGITIECEVDDEKNLKNAMSEVQVLSKQLNILPVSVEKRKGSNVLFGLQYPELIPHYTTEEVKKMYCDMFRFLFDNIKMKDPTKITKPILIENMDRLVKHAITNYCRSNINQYRETFDDYYKNAKYRAQINAIYLEFLEIYLMEEK